MKRFIAMTAFLFIASTAGLAHTEAPLRLGLLAYRPKPQTMAQWRPLAAYLQTALRQPVELIVYDHAELSVAAAQRAVDVVITTPNHFILLQHTSGLSAPLATLVSREGSHTLSVYGGVMFARADRGDIKTLADLYGKRIASVSTDAFAGYQMNVEEMLDAGVPPPAGDRLLLTGQPHDLVIEAVLAGRADVGFTRAGLLESLAREGKANLARIKIINQQEFPSFPYRVSTRLYPEWPVAVMPQVDPQLARRLAAALLLLPPDVFKKTAPSIHGFTTPANYDSVENLMRHLRLPPFDRGPEITPADLWRRYSLWIVALAALLALLAGTSGGLVVLERRSLRALHELERMREQEKKTLAILAQSEAKYRRMVDTAQEGIWVLGPDGSTVFTNARMAEMLGYEAGDLNGRPVAGFLHEEDLPDHEKKMSARRNGISETYERRFQRKDGGIVWTLASAAPLFDEAHRFSGYFGMFTDITERKIIEEKLRALNAELEQRVRDRTAELEAKNRELEKLNRLFVGRELRMVELKAKVRKLEGS